jgi:DNA-binding XRE family transcriptional regulator
MNMNVKFTVIFTKKVAKNLKKIPLKIRNRFFVLAEQLMEKGPNASNWANFSKLEENKYHCHLARSWVACWTYEKKTLSSRSIMLLVVKTPHTELKIKGIISPLVLKALKDEFGAALKIRDDSSNDELINILDTDLYKKFKDRVTPGDYVRIYRENHSLSQTSLGEKLGVSRSYICDIEKGRRSISKDMAKKIEDHLHIPVSRLI